MFAKSPLSAALIAAILVVPMTARAAANGKKLIEWGWDQPDTAFMRQHIEQMEQTPFDGTVFAVKTDHGSWLTDAYWGAEAITPAQLTTSLADLQATRFTKFTDNFLRLNVTPYGLSGGIDWFDDFSNIITNSRSAAQLAMDGGVKGILLDTEQYTQQIFNYGAQRSASTRTFAQYAAQARLRGAQIMQAYQEGYSDLTLFLSLGHSLPGIRVANEPSLLPGNSYGLLAPFLDGMFEAATGDTKIVDGCELGYPISVARDSAERIEWFLNYINDKGHHPDWWNVLPIVGVDHEKYKRHISAGFGTWMDYQTAAYPWDPDDVDNWFTPEDLEATLKTSLQFADEYAWVYTEQPRWWTAEGGMTGISPAYLAAVQNAVVPEPAGALVLLVLVVIVLLATHCRWRHSRAVVAMMSMLVVAGVGPSSFGGFLITESFDVNTDLSNSGWESLNNRTSPQNYGWSNTNNTGSMVNPPISGTASGAGELGGTITRDSTPPTFYGFNVGSIDLSEDFEARGVIRYSSGTGGFNLGYFRGAESYGSSGNARNFVGYFFDDSRDAYSVIFNPTGGRERSDSPYNLVAGRTHAFRMEYRTNGFNPDTLVLTLDGNVHVQPVGLVPPDLLPFTHFGILPTSADGGSGVVWLDDLTFTSNRVPEPASFGLIICIAAAALRARRQAR
jgi:hypothetical protein